MLQALVNRVGRLLDDLNGSLLSRRALPAVRSGPSPATSYRSLERVVLTDEVARTLFEEYTEHRDSSRGQEETGWVLLGLRHPDEALVLATLPAGAECSAGVAHVRFNTDAQALGSRIVRQIDRRLTILGVVHTHPGTLRHPSDGDYRGDSVWVRHLRGREGIFAIGTVESGAQTEPAYARRPQPHVQCWTDMRLSWYALRHGDRSYRMLPHGLTLGPDLARPLHAVWGAIEAHAEPLERLYKQQARISFEVVVGNRGPALAVEVPLADAGDAIRVLLEGKEVRYLVRRRGDVALADIPEPRVDRGVYLLLAELAGPGG